MCGITGWVDFKKQLVQEKQTMDRMTDTLSKRGPDDSNVWGEHHVLFGHKRLAVVDIEGGRQPMACTYKGDTYTIIYNGELYNTEDLRKELRARAINSNVRQIPRCFCTATSNGRKTVSTISMAYSLSLCGMKSVICCLPRETVSA